MKLARLAALAACALLAGCELFMSVEPGPSENQEWRGLRFSLVVEEPAAPEQTYRLSLRITNVSDERRIREFPSSCMFWSRLYRAGDLSRPVWDLLSRTTFVHACTGGPRIDLRPGEFANVDVFRLHPEDVLGDPLPEGRYIPGALVRPQEGASPEFILVASEPIELSME